MPKRCVMILINLRVLFASLCVVKHSWIIQVSCRSSTLIWDSLRLTDLTSPFWRAVVSEHQVDSDSIVKTEQHYQTKHLFEKIAISI